MQKLAPIALFVYNRPEHTRRTLSFLKKNLLAEESRLYIFSDGAKNPSDEDKVEEVRLLISKTEGFKSIKIICRETNLGLANSIISGVSQLVKDYGKVIVFEDDLLSSPQTLSYFNHALDFYQNETKVMHIGAYMYPINTSQLPQTFFYRAATSWGWATWERAWEKFNPDIDDLFSRFNREKSYQFSVDGSMNYWKQMKEFKSGRNNSWAIRWYASIFLENGLTLNPSKSLVSNIGHDGSGIHSGTTNIYDVTLTQKPVTFFPTSIEENKTAYEALKTYFKNRKGSLLKRFVRYLKQKF